MPGQVIIADQKVQGNNVGYVARKCNRCGQPYQTAFEQYVICGCQDQIVVQTSAMQGQVLDLPIVFRNDIVALFTLGRAAQELVKFIPNAASMVAG